MQFVCLIAQFPCLIAQFPSLIDNSSFANSSRAFVKDGLSRDYDLHSRDHLPSPNQSAPQTNAFFLMVFVSLHNYTVLHDWFTFKFHGFGSD